MIFKDPSLRQHIQEAQLKEIFDLFDTDGGGTIDRQEVCSNFMVAGIGTKHSTRHLPCTNYIEISPSYIHPAQLEVETD